MSQGLKQFYTLREVAEILSVDVETIRKAVNEGELVALRVNDAANSAWRIQQEDFWAWVERKKQEAQRGSSNDH